MSVYKVPQDVEAEDKLLGPFSFRQFIYIIIAVMALALAYGLSRILLPLIIIPLPVAIFFGILALPLKKDQPMETYLAALISFYVKPRRRLWKADGVQSLIEIVQPKLVEEQRTKDLSQMEAEQRLSYLANLVDSRGWAVRGVNTVPQIDNTMQDDAFFAAQQTQDILDDGSPLTHSFDNMIDNANSKRREEAIKLVSQPVMPAPIPPVTDPYATLPVPNILQTAAMPQQDDSTTISFNPYPESMHQTIVNPEGVAPTQTPPATSQPSVTPDIMNLANNSDLSIETIAHEAQRIHEREAKLSDEEVVISLR